MAAKTVKAVNYTAEQTAKAVADYQAGISVETIAAELGKTVRSVVAKLSREKVYKAKEYTTKTGEKPEAKALLAGKICDAANISAEHVESLAKANKQALVGILAALNRD